MSELGHNFYNKLLEVASNVGMKPEDILNVMALESGLNPSATAPGTNAVGLVQIMPKYLSNYGYTGTAKDFKSESAESQLIYVERLIKSLIKMNGGRPFTSAVQYYVANFLPAALRIPGVQREDFSTIISSKDPKTPHIPGFGIEFEKKVYKANSGLDSDKDGNITYGDLRNRLGQVANRKVFIDAVNDMKKYTGYEANIKSKKQDDKKIEFNKDTVKANKEDNMSEVYDLLNKFLHNVKASDNGKLYKKYLPNNNILIHISSNNLTNSIEFSRILCSALNEELNAKAYPYTNGKDVEVECKINGPEKECNDAVKELSNLISDMFKQATIKIGGIKINQNIITNKTSSYIEINSKQAEENYKKFISKFS